MILNIVSYPSPILREKTFEVEEITEDIKSLVRDLVDTMFSRKAIGIAAIQVGRLERIFIVDSWIVTDSEFTDPLVFINPTILEYGKETISHSEGCLSFPNTSIRVQRPSWVRVRAKNLSGEIFETEGKNLFGRCLQHEYDHLNGNLMIDKANFFERKRVEKQFRN